MKNKKQVWNPFIYLMLVYLLPEQMLVRYGPVGL